MKLLRNRMKDAVEKHEVIPEYYLKKQKKKIPLAWVIVIGVILLLAIAVYMPPLFFKYPEKHYQSVELLTNTAAMKELSDFKINNPDKDFDDDGLLNEQENSQGNGTGLYTADHDDDGVSDYAELYITNTNPRVPDTGGEAYLQKLDNSSGNKVNIPFEDGGVVMWADDYASKLRGSAIQTKSGRYLFTHFNGWVQFPDDIKSAYKYENDLHSSLQKNEQGYYYIESKEKNVIVDVFTEDVPTCACLSLLTKNYRIGGGFWSNVLEFVLPSSGVGLITCKEAIDIDFQKNGEEVDVQNTPVYCDVEKLQVSNSRFLRNYTQLSDLLEINNHLNNGETVLISFMSSSRGEAFAEIYGKTNENNLLICDTKTGDPLGVLQISIRSTRMLDKTSSVSLYEYFLFAGCGFSSANRDRISIIAYLPQSGDAIGVNLGENINRETSVPVNTEPTEPTEPTESTEPSEPTEPATSEPTQETTMETLEPIYPDVDTELLNAIMKTDFGAEVSYKEIKEKGRYEKRLSECTEEQARTYLQHVIDDLGFDYYYSDWVNKKTEDLYWVICDKYTNIVSIKYYPSTNELSVVFESYNGEQSIELYDTKFIEH